MDIRLEPSEARALGVLIEKELSTPDGYPLSLNALSAGCNQKSNRDPLMQMPSGEVFSSVERLRMQQLAGATHPAGSRVEKFHHNARERLALDGPALAVIAELLLRGPQQPGELRSRASRMCRIDSLPELKQVLAELEQRGFVREIPPLPGSRAARVATTLVELPAAARTVAVPNPAPSATPVPAQAQERSAAPTPVAQAAAPAPDLAARVATLERQLAHLAERLGETLPG